MKQIRNNLAKSKCAKVPPKNTSYLSLFIESYDPEFSPSFPTPKTHYDVCSKKYLAMYEVCRKFHEQDPTTDSISDEWLHDSELDAKSTRELQQAFQRVLMFKALTKQHPEVIEKGNLNYLKVIKVVNKLNAHAITTSMHPFQLATRCAHIVREWLATENGTVLDLEKTVQLCWVTMKNSMNKEFFKEFPTVDKFDALDRAMAKIQADILAHDGLLAAKTLERRLVKKTHLFLKLVKTEDLYTKLSTYAARIHLKEQMLTKRIDSKEKQKLTEFILTQIKRYQKQCSLGSFSYDYLVNRMVDLFEMFKDCSSKEIDIMRKDALNYVYQLHLNPFSQSHISGDLYKLIQSELLFIKEAKNNKPIEKILDSLVKIFESAKLITGLSSFHIEDIKAICYLNVFQFYKLAKLPNDIELLFNQELCIEHLNHPKYTLFETTSNLYRRYIHLYNAIEEDYEDLDQLETVICNKAESFAIQNLNIYSWIQLDRNSILFTLFKNNPKLSCLSSLEQASEKIIKIYPQLKIHFKQLNAEMMKYAYLFHFKSEQYEKSSVFDVSTKLIDNLNILSGKEIAKLFPTYQVSH